MALLINLIISIMTIYNGFLNTDNYKIKLLQSFKASKLQILTNVVIPESYSTIISSLKINIGMSQIGVIMGEFLVSRQGIGYLIIYGTQIFNLNIVMSGIIILIIISFILYKIIEYIEKKLLKEK
jgi:NitT/TauT family transport system permease protein